MAVVLGQSAPWTDGERQHLASCVDCAAEWGLVQATRRMGARSEYRPDVERLAARIQDRIAATAGAERPARRWGLNVARNAAWLTGLAAAAALALMVWRGIDGAPRPHVTGSRAVAVSPAAGLSTAQAELAVPVLDSLDAGELKVVLDGFDEALAERATIVVPSPADLTDSELKRVLRAEGV